MTITYGKVCERGTMTVRHYASINVPDEQMINVADTVTALRWGIERVVSEDGEVIPTEERSGRE